MDLGWLLLVAVIAGIAYRGFRLGLLELLSRTLSLPFGYFCAVLATGAVIRLLQTYTSFQGVLLYLLVPLLLLLGGIFLANLGFTLLEAYLGHRLAERAHTWGGAVLGALIGCLVGVVLLWSVFFIRDIWPRQPALAWENVSVQRFSSARFSSWVMGRAAAFSVGLVQDDPLVIAAAVAWMSGPGEITLGFQRLMVNRDLRLLFGDRANLQLLEPDRLDELRARPEFQRLADNPDIYQLARLANLVEVDSEQSFDHQLALKLSALWQRAKAVRQQPRWREIVSDHEFVERVRKAQPAQLLADPQVRELMGMMFAVEV